MVYSHKAHHPEVCDLYQQTTKNTVAMHFFLHSMMITFRIYLFWFTQAYCYFVCVRVFMSTCRKHFAIPSFECKMTNALRLNTNEFLFRWTKLETTTQHPDFSTGLMEIDLSTKFVVQMSITINDSNTLASRRRRNMWPLSFTWRCVYFQHNAHSKSLSSLSMLYSHWKSACSRKWNGRMCLSVAWTPSFVYSIHSITLCYVQLCENDANWHIHGDRSFAYE